MDCKEKFAKRLVMLRELRQMTQQELADELKITRQSLSLYEKAERTINIELLAKIADFFNVTADYLLGLSDTPSVNMEMQAICKATGLEEFTIRHLQKLQSDKFYGEIFDVLNAFISNITTHTLYLIKTIHAARIKRRILKKEVIKKFCHKRKIGIKDQEIEERGIYCFRNVPDGLLLLGECEIEIEKNLHEYSYIDSDLRIDIDYQSFMISKELMDLIDDKMDFNLYEDLFTEHFFEETSRYYADALQYDSGSPEFAKFLQESYNSGKTESVCPIGSRHKKEVQNHGKHNTTKE